MNYLKIYCNLIRKAENRTPPEGYTEKHHTFPKSIFGENNRIVILTSREHYIAHALLERICIKRYGLNHIRTQKMAYAHFLMNDGKRYYNSLLYEESRKRVAEIHSRRFGGKNNPRYGKLGIYKHSEKSRNKISQQNLGKKWWNNGTKNKCCKKCPGDEWIRGRISKPLPSRKGSTWWNNGTQNKCCKECPGPNWVAGIKRKTDKPKKKLSKEIIERRIQLNSERIWWNNGIENKFCKESPGENWINGRIIRTTTNNFKWWNDGCGNNKFSIECPGPNWVAGMSKESKQKMSKMKKKKNND